MILSANFTTQEFEWSDTAQERGISNKIAPEHFAAIKELVSSILQPLRDVIKKPIKISSGYRCQELNKVVGGASTSQHTKGEAADIKIAGMEPVEVAKVILTRRLPFDQLIIYPTFVHVSHKYKSCQRGQVLYNKAYKGPKIKL